MYTEKQIFRPILDESAFQHMLSRDEKQAKEVYADIVARFEKDMDASVQNFLSNYSFVQDGDEWSMSEEEGEHTLVVVFRQEGGRIKLQGHVNDVHGGQNGDYAGGRSNSSATGRLWWLSFGFCHLLHRII